MLSRMRVVLDAVDSCQVTSAFMDRHRRSRSDFRQTRRRFGDEAMPRGEDTRAKYGLPFRWFSSRLSDESPKPSEVNPVFFSVSRQISATSRGSVMGNKLLDDGGVASR